MWTFFWKFPLLAKAAERLYYNCGALRKLFTKPVLQVATLSSIVCTLNSCQPKQFLRFCPHKVYSYADWIGLKISFHTSEEVLLNYPYLSLCCSSRWCISPKWTGAGGDPERFAPGLSASTSTGGLQLSIRLKQNASFNEKLFYGNDLQLATRWWSSFQELVIF